MFFFSPDRGRPCDTSLALSHIYGHLEKLADTPLVTEESAPQFCKELGRLIRNALALSQFLESSFRIQLPEKANGQLKERGEK